MDCTECREAYEADPSQVSDAVAAHADSCKSCDAYRARLLQAEELIAAALRFDVAALRGEREQRAKPGTWSAALSAGLAASLVAIVMVALAPRPIDDRGIGLEAAQHWELEPASWVVSGKPVPDFSLQQVLSGHATLDRDALPVISYAHPCPFRGKTIPHLVIQGANGPVMVLLLPHESLEEAAPFSAREKGLEGVVVPFGKGSIVFLGTKGEPLERMHENLSKALEWST